MIDEERVRRLLRDAAQLPGPPVGPPVEMIVAKGRKSLRRLHVTVIAVAVAVTAGAITVPVAIAASRSSSAPAVHIPHPRRTTPHLPTLPNQPSVPGIQLNAIAGSGPDDVWAAGSDTGAVKVPQAHHAVIYHFDGTGWTLVDHPATDSVDDLTAPDPNSAWALAGNNTVLHWNGATWSRSPLPALPSAVYLNAISASSAADVWIVGTRPAAPWGRNHQNPGSRTLTIHWNGVAWSIVTSPNRSPDINQADAVLSVSPDDAWLVGDTQVGLNRRTLTAHWDGRSWAVVPSPNPGDHRYLYLFDVGDDGHGQVWTVGEYRTGSHYQPLFLRYTGTRWQQVPAAPGTGIRSPAAVSGSAPDDVWEAGGTVGSHTYFIEHYDGNRWTNETLPTPDGEVDNSAQLTDISAISATDAWATGQYFSRGKRPHRVEFQQLLLHWDGTAWTQRTLPSAR